MDTKDIIILVLCGIVIIMFAIFIILQVKSKSPKGKADNVKVIDGVRYTKSGIANNDNILTHIEGDFVLVQGVNYTIRKDSALIPGKYTLMSCDEGAVKFNLRVGTYVREFNHSTDVIFADGDIICAVSHNVLLR